MRYDLGILLIGIYVAGGDGLVNPSSFRLVALEYSLRPHRGTDSPSLGH